MREPPGPVETKARVNWLLSHVPERVGVDRFHVEANEGVARRVDSGERPLVAAMHDSETMEAKSSVTRPPGTRRYSRARPAFPS